MYKNVRLGLGFISVLLSDPVLSGFLLAASILIPSSQLKHAFGVDIQHGALWGGEMYRVAQAVGQGEATWMAFGIFASSVVFLVFCRHANKHWSKFQKYPLPGELLVVVVATVITWAFDLFNNEGVAVYKHQNIQQSIHKTTKNIFFIRVFQQFLLSVFSVYKF